MPGHSHNIEIIRSAYDGFRRGDIEAVLAIMTPDVEWVHPHGMDTYRLGGTKIGHAGIEEFLAHVPNVLAGMRLDPQEFVESGDRVVVFGTRDVTSLSGQVQTLRFVHSWTMREGKATRMEDIFDTVLLHRLIES
jgi:ketosteroid isomerase-like protein